MNIENETILETTSLEAPWKSSLSEPYGIRRFNPNNSEDSQILSDINRHPEVGKWMVGESTDEGMKAEVDWMIRGTEGEKTDPILLFAVVNEQNKPVGWVMFYLDTYLSEELKRQNAISDNSLVLEVSYAKSLIEWPTETDFITERDNLQTEQSTHVAVNGLKQAALFLKLKEETISEEMATKPRSLVITAYTDPTNIPSERVLESNNFMRIGEVDYDGEQNTVWLKKL